MPSLPQVTSETAIAERFAPWRDVSFEALEVKKPILKPFTATLPWHDVKRGKSTMLSLSGAAAAAGIAKSRSGEPLSLAASRRSKVRREATKSTPRNYSERFLQRTKTLK
jgi:hypothetical protein